MNNELRSFIKESLERGQSKDAIHAVLTQSGWEDGEVRNGLAAFADVDFPIAVPRPTPYLHAREAFLYLVSFIALYVSAISFGFLVFGLIDHTFHDPLTYRDRFPSTGEATSIASVIVAFPLYLFLMKRLASEMAAEPEKRRSLVRRWLTYLTLVIAAGFILGDVIALLANLLTGDLAFLFLLKGLAILVVTACIFGFYLWDMRRSETLAVSANATNALRAFLGIVVLLVVACLAYSMFLLGTPGEQRSLRFDEQRISDLKNISRNVDLYWETNQNLPESFDDMSGPRYSIFSIHDPESEEEYEYRVIEEVAYELCAIFTTDSAEIRSPDLRFSEEAWAHGIGRTCFQLEPPQQLQLQPPPAAPSTGDG